jgi:hypothetical protein
VLDPAKQAERIDAAKAQAQLEGVLTEGETADWWGDATLAAERVIVLVTSARLLWAPVGDPRRWQALAHDDLAAHGVVIPRETMLTVAFSAEAGGLQRLEFRSRGSTDFRQVPWPPALRDRIDQTLETSARVGAGARRWLTWVALGLLAGVAIAVALL